MSSVKLVNCLHLWYTYYQRKVSVKELHRILVKVVDTYELQEFDAVSKVFFYCFQQRKT